MAPMRIAYLTNQYPKVSHSFIRREILAVERLGVEVTRLALRGWDEKLVDGEDKAERARTRYVLQGGAGLGSAMVRMALLHPLRFARAFSRAIHMSRRGDRPLPVHLIYLAEACRIASWLEADRIQHLHAHFGTNSAEVAMLTRILGGPPWSFTVHGPEEFDKAPLIRLSEKIHDCDFVVAVCSFGRSQLYRIAERRDWSKIKVVHCGLDRSFSAAVNVTPSAKQLVCVGRLCEQKGQLLLVEAARHLTEQGQSFTLVFAGDGELRGEIEMLVKRYKLERTIRITGWISGAQVREEILASRALVLPSFAEGLPVSIMEAMALCRPIISTYVAGIPELVRSGTEGWLVPAGDVAALVEAMRSCLNAPVSLLERMGRAARERVLERHDIDVEAAKLAALISRSIDQNVKTSKSVELDRSFSRTNTKNCNE